MPERLSTIAIGDYGYARHLETSLEKVHVLNIMRVQVSSMVELVRRMTRELEFDIAEVSLGTYLPARTFGVPFTAIPVFPVRSFYHSSILCRSDSGINTPSDLHGRRVGVNRGWTVTAGIWARAILATEYGVDLKSISWVTTGDDHVQQYTPPDNVSPAPQNMNLADLFNSGQIDAVVGVRRLPEIDVQHVITNPFGQEHSYFRRTGIYPINHAVVLRNTLLENSPRIGDLLLSAFQEAKEHYLRQLRLNTQSEQDKILLGMQELMGLDPLPYGIEPNRITLEALIEACVDQQIIPGKISVDDMFAS